jgi:hypothetical protein
MTRDEKITRNKLGVLELAKKLGSVSQACRVMGFSRGSFYWVTPHPPGFFRWLERTRRVQ